MIAMRNTTNSTEIRAYDGQTCQYEPSREQIFQAYKRRIMTEGLRPGEVKQSTRYNVIQYLCSFPHLDPDEMAAAVIREGVTVAFDDSSISQRENAAHERRVRRLLQTKAQPTSAGRRRTMNAIETIVKHGRYAAAKWAGHADSRPYWEARYCGIQALYSDLTDSPTAYADFNARCGVTFEAGHIVAADGTQCID